MKTYRCTLLSLLLALGSETLAGTSNLAFAQTPQKDLCHLFNAAEIGKLLGTAVENGDPILGTGCQWFGKDEESFVVIQVADTTHWLDPRQAPGYQPIQGLGKKAYSHQDPDGGWRAMALTDKSVSIVVLTGGSETRDAAITILRRLVGS